MKPGAPTVDGRLLASLCHDLRGPLGALGTWVHVLASGRADEATRVRALDAMGRAVREQGALLDQFSDLAALLEGAAGGERLPVELGALVRQVVGALPAPQLVSVSGETSGPTVQADVERVRRMLSVLLGGAVKGGDAAYAMSVAREGSEAVLVLTATGTPRAWSVALVSALATDQGGGLDVTSEAGTVTLRVRLPLD